MGTEYIPDHKLELDALGCKLSAAINCPVTLVGDKPVFECKHRVHFMQWIVKESPGIALLEYHTDNIHGVTK